MRFRDKIALITGAGSGIGRATAQIMGEEGGTIVGVDVSQDSLEQVLGGIRQGGGIVKGIVADALEADQVTRTVQQTVDEYGRIDILVNAVGGSTIIPNSRATVDELTLEEWQRLLHFNLTGTFLFAHAVVSIMKRQHRGKIEVQQTVDEYGRIDILVNAVGGSTIIPNSRATVDELTLEEWQRLLHFNLTGTFLFAHAVVPIMKRQHRGKIVNLSSVAGRGFSDSSSAYSTAKGGLIAFTRKLSFELGPFGITCNAIAPSRTLSERIHPRWEQMSEAEQQVHLAKIPLRRIALPEDQARVICFLASSDADYVTGVTIDVTGGQ